MKVTKNFEISKNHFFFFLSAEFFQISAFLGLRLHINASHVEEQSVAPYTTFSDLIYQQL